MLAHLLLLLAPIVAEGNQWGPREIRIEVERNYTNLSQARDLKVFCPEFNGDTSTGKQCFVAFAMAVIKLESNGVCSERFDESRFRPGMLDSIGLFQLSEGECHMGESIFDCRGNINCGIRKMGQLIAKAGYIGGSGREGAARYWSVIRPPYKVGGNKAKNGAIVDGRIQVGRKDDLIRLTNEYFRQGKYQGN